MTANTTPFTGTIDQLNSAMLRALGIDPKGLTKAVVTIQPGQMPTIEVVLAAYDLVPNEGPARGQSVEAPTVVMEDIIGLARSEAHQEIATGFGLRPPLARIG